VNKLATLSVQPLEEMYLNPLTRYDTGFGNIRHVRLFILIATVILMIALINFINLATARSETRAKEISLRKVTGARRPQLVRQFMGESLLFTLIATIGAILILQLMLPWFRTVTGKSLPVNFLNPAIWLVLGGLAVVSGLAAGIYPALFLSGQSPVWGRQHRNTTRSGNFRKVLVILQFAVSVGLMIGTWVIYDQLNFMRQKNWHLDNDIVIHVPVKENVGTQFEVFKNSLLSNPRITAIGVKNCLPTTLTNNTSGVFWPGKTRAHNDIFMETTRVDCDYFKTVGMEMAAGRSFSPEYPSDQTGAYILNETAVKLTGLKDPVGKPFRLYNQPGQIIGVVKDTYFKSLKRELNPQVYHLFTDLPRQAFFGSVFIRIQKTVGSRDLRDMITFIGQKWRDINSVAPFEYHFLDDTILDMYANDLRLSKIVTSFCFLAIFISCLGLFGLSAFIVQKRVREIGIRKTLGASSRQLMVMLSGEFSRWVLISFLISMPAAYYVMKKWLENFAYRSVIGWEIFVFSGILALIIAVLTVSYQAARAAATNPVDTIRER
jgi:ABC-type antimicrobial peptide transport system permease subunit